MKKIIILIILLFTRYAFAAVQDPVNFPDGRKCGNAPVFIWEDIYTNGKNELQFSLEIQDENSKISSFSFTPAVFEDRIYAFKPAISLPEGNYSYKISASFERRYFGYRKYPVSGTFTVDNSAENELQALELENASFYIYHSYYNRQTNGFDSLFFFSASSVSLAAGITVYYFLNYNIYTAIASYALMGAAAIGYPASAYYGVKYLSRKGEIKKLYLENKISMDVYFINENLYGGVTTRF